MFPQLVGKKDQQEWRGTAVQASMKYLGETQAMKKRHENSSLGTQQAHHCNKFLKNQTTAEAAPLMRGQALELFSTNSINHNFTVNWTEYSPPDTYTPYNERKERSSRRKRGRSRGGGRKQ